VIGIPDLIPNPEDLLCLEAEELAGVLLVHLNSGGGALHHYNFFNSLRNYPLYPTHNEQVNQALMEAWDWLTSEGFLARRADDSTRGSVFITRRGQRLKTREDFAAYRKAGLFPKGQLHPMIASRVYPAFLRGEYDTAVFQAFREVEVSVRVAGKFGPDDYGTDLMRSAFRPIEKKGRSVAPGPLTDTQLPIAEQEAMANLFAGAISLYKNPQSHRHVPTEAISAAEVITFASHLLRLVDQVTPAASLPAATGHTP
jgi:uncharacterized protein (TIGR02391 family)